MFVIVTLHGSGGGVGIFIRRYATFQVPPRPNSFESCFICSLIIIIIILVDLKGCYLPPLLACWLADIMATDLYAELLAEWMD